jgi:hypothetical protein
MGKKPLNEADIDLKSALGPENGFLRAHANEAVTAKRPTNPRGRIQPCRK